METVVICKVGQAYELYPKEMAEILKVAPTFARLIRKLYTASVAGAINGTM